MEILQWIFIIGVAITIIFIIFILYFFFSFINQGKQISKEENRGQGRRKRKKQKRLLEELYLKRKISVRNMFFSFLLAMVFGLGSGYVTYYQATNLSDEDMTSISDGFYYLRDLKGELEAIQSGDGDIEKSKQTINFIVTSLAGYSVKQASTFNTVDGQRILNRYYKAMAELGINVSRNSTTMLTDEVILTESLTDLEKVQTYQKKALDFFKIDASALEAQK